MGGWLERGGTGIMGRMKDWEEEQLKEGQWWIDGMGTVVEGMTEGGKVNWNLKGTGQWMENIAMEGWTEWMVMSEVCEMGKWENEWEGWLWTYREWLKQWLVVGCDRKGMWIDVMLKEWGSKKVRIQGKVEQIIITCQLQLCNVFHLSLIHFSLNKKDYSSSTLRWHLELYSCLCLSLFC